MTPKYISQLRRGIRYVDDMGATLVDDNGNPIRDDWATYTAQENHIDPIDGELVVEFEYNPMTGKKIPRLKIGDGESTFANLEYISVDSFILPKYSYITIAPDAWELAEDGRYGQVVTVQNATITPCSKVDLAPTPEDLVIFHEKDLTFVTENDDGIITVYCVGQRLGNEYTIPVTVTEVNIND